MDTPSGSEIRRGEYVARFIEDDMSWGVGSIQPIAEYVNPESQRRLTEVVLDNIKPVPEAEVPYSACTDGRIPVQLLSGEPVPVREQNVGADTMIMFHMAEALGPRFYKDPRASLPDRMKQVVTFMHDNGLRPSTHVACGAGAGYEAINNNLPDFTRNGLFVARQQILLPKNMYNNELRSQVTGGYEDRQRSEAYRGWSGDIVMDAVRYVSGERAIAELQDDGRGVHGHVEEQIVRVKVDGVAIDEAAVAAQTGGREVFGVNDNRLWRLAKIISRGVEEDYHIAAMAGEDFTDGGHGTLSKGLPTLVVTRA